MVKLKIYTVTISTPTVSFQVEAKNKKEAEELGWFEYDQLGPQENIVLVEEVK